MKKTGLLELDIIKMLGLYASKTKPISQKDLKRRLDEVARNEVSRDTLSDYLHALEREGYVAQAHNRGWYRVNPLTDTQLKMAIDAILYAKQIPKEVALKLIEKLKSISPLNLKDYVKNVDYIEDVNHTENEKVGDFLEIIGEAIERNKRLLITPRWLKHKKDESDEGYRRGTPFIADPYYIVTDKCRYYLICHVDRMGQTQGVENRRIDRFDEVVILDEKRMPIETLPIYSTCLHDGLGRYMREHLYMFSGEARTIRMRISDYDIGEFIDWYGRKYQVEKESLDEEDHTVYDIRFTANENAIFYWIMQYGSKATILDPPRLRGRIVRHHEEMLQKYTELEKSCNSGES